MLIQRLISALLVGCAPLYFGGSRRVTPAPLPASPTEDPALEAEREKVRRQAVVDLGMTGRYSTVHAGRMLTDESFTQQIKRRKSKGTELGGF